MMATCELLCACHRPGGGSCNVNGGCAPAGQTIDEHQAKIAPHTLTVWNAVDVPDAVRAQVMALIDPYNPDIYSRDCDETGSAPHDGLRRNPGRLAGAASPPCEHEIRRRGQGTTLGTRNTATVTARHCAQFQTSDEKFKRIVCASMARVRLVTSLLRRQHNENT